LRATCATFLESSVKLEPAHFERGIRGTAIDAVYENIEIDLAQELDTSLTYWEQRMIMSALRSHVYTSSPFPEDGPPARPQ